MINKSWKAVAAISFSISLSFAADAPLVFEKAIPLPGVEGRIDHMAAGAAAGLLFIAALGNNSVQVLDLQSGKTVKSIGQMQEPQGIVYRPETNRLSIATGGDGSVRIFESKSFRLLQTTKLGDDADNLRFDDASGLLWAGYGRGALAALDGEGKQLFQIKLSGHPESFQMEKHGPRIFVNVPGAKQVAVVDREQKKVISTWGTGLDFSNYPMALDEKSKRLFIVCRVPARLLVIDTTSGKTVAKLPTVGDSDDVFYDAERRRIYVSGGEGAIEIFQQSDPDRYASIARIKTAAGARTSLFVPETNRLYVAVPHRGAQAAEIRVYKAN